MSGAPRLGAKGAANIHRNMKWLYAFILVVYLFLKLSKGVFIASITAWTVLLLVLILLHHLAHRGAIKGDARSRILSVLLAILLLPGFPIGTFIATTLMAYNSEWKEYLESKVS